MKKILSITVIILLFIVSTLMFWSIFWPDNFWSFFLMYPRVNRTAVQVGTINPIRAESLQSTSTDLVFGKTGQVLIKGNVWNVEIAKNELDRESGLSNRHNLYSRSGMLFVFDKVGRQSFWMKDMLIPIDMIFLDENWKIVLIESDVQPDSFPKIFGSSVKAQYVLEINALEAKNYDLEVGDQAVFFNIEHK